MKLLVRTFPRPRAPRASRLLVLLGALSALGGCGTVCDDAGVVCGFDESIADQCTGVTECAAVCIVDWDSCDVNDAESEVAKCIAVCLEAGEEGT